MCRAPQQSVEWVFTIAGALLLALLGLAVALLVIPTRIEARGVFRDDLIDASADARWALGLAGVHVSPRDGVAFRLVGLPVYRLAHFASDDESEDDDEEPEEGRSRRRRPGARFVVRLVRRALSSLRVRARVAGRVGTGNPADTAWMYGAVASARQWVPSLDVDELRVDWLEPVLELDGTVVGRVWPIELAWIVATEWWRDRRRRTT